MSQLPNCPKCNSEYVYEDGTLRLSRMLMSGIPLNKLAEEGIVAIDADKNKPAGWRYSNLDYDLKVKGALKDPQTSETV